MFIIFGVMVLVSLFVGIIITSMELLKEGMKEEDAMWAKVRERQKRYKLDDADIDNMLEVFDTVDKNSVAQLTVSRFVLPN